MSVELPRAVLHRVVARAAGSRIGALRVELRPLRKGLESHGVVAITARFRDELQRRRTLHLVAKHLGGRGVREAAVYENLVAAHVADTAPRVLGAHLTRDGGTLFLENVRQTCAWPWTDVAHSAEVLRCVAVLHMAPHAGVALPPWDYEAELARSTAETLEAIDRTRGDALVGDARSSLPALRRVGASIGAVRRRLLSGPLPVALIHGDLHSANVVVRSARRAPGAPRIALIDWQRARLGSPLEDVSSFLQSLAYWEPEVRSRHDTLLGEYLAARGFDRNPSRELRDAYWLAGATNAFAGALRYHVVVATTAAAPERTRDRATRAVRDWLRIVRRADAVWGGGVP